MNRNTILVTHFAEGLSGDILHKHQEVVQHRVRGKSGVYALYKNRQIWYVGRASDLHRRLGQHLEDRHAGRWNRFSVFITRKEGTEKELEALLRRVAKPEGNSQNVNFIGAEDMQPEMLSQAEQNAMRSVKDDFTDSGLQPSPGVTRSAKPLHRGFRLDRSRTVRLKCRGKWIRGFLRRNLKIRARNKTFGSPSGAAKFFLGWTAVDGWYHWLYKHPGKGWIPIRNLRR